MILLLALAAAAQAPEPQATLESRFQRLDRNADGFITANEAPRVSQARGAPSGASPWIDARDRDRDGRVSLAEFVAPARPALVRASFAPAPSE